MPVLQKKPAQQTGSLEDCFTLEASGGVIHTTRPLRPFSCCYTSGRYLPVSSPWARFGDQGLPQRCGLTILHGRADLRRTTTRVLGPTNYINPWQMRD